MPFDYDSYQLKCDGMTAEQLQKEWENYTRQMSAGATSTATSILFMPFTAGLSVVGVGLSAPRIHNARKKREIIEAGLKARGTTHKTRAGDVLAPMAVSGIIGGLTLGLVPPGVDSVAGVAAGRGLEIAATNTALNATEAVVVDTARKMTANDTQGPEQKPKYGTMATPFLIDESVLAFQQRLDQPPAPPFTTNYQVEVPATDLKMQTRQSQPPPAISGAALSTPAHNVEHSDIGDHDLSHLLTIDEEDILRMHALALEMEKREAGKQHVDLANIQIQSQLPTQTQVDEVENQLQSLAIIQENQVHSDEAAIPHLSNQPELQGHPPALPPRWAPHSATTLPARLYSPQTVSSSSQDTLNSQFPSQSLPPYQPQYFPQGGVVAEPQQYYPPPPAPKQRQDSGYNSMYSTPSIGSASPQTYAIPPNFSRDSSIPQSHPAPPNGLSRHSSIPQSYPPSSTSFYPPQMKAHQAHRTSESSLYPMTPPPPYDPPPHSLSISLGTGKETDYFNQNAVPPSSSTHKNSSHLPFNHLLEQSQTLVDGMNKGWKWARASALPVKAPMDSKTIVEPDYGAPPPVPAEWRGS